MAPVGSRESLAAAIQAGADSIYFGILFAVILLLFAIFVAFYSFSMCFPVPLCSTGSPVRQRRSIS